MILQVNWTDCVDFTYTQPVWLVTSPPPLLSDTILPTQTTTSDLQLGLTDCFLKKFPIVSSYHFSVQYRKWFLKHLSIRSILKNKIHLLFLHVWFQSQKWLPFWGGGWWQTSFTCLQNFWYHLFVCFPLIDYVFNLSHDFWTIVTKTQTTQCSFE